MASAPRRIALRSFLVSGSRISWSESKIAPPEGGPAHEGRATALATVGAMAVGDVIRLAGRFIADCAAQTTCVNNACHHSPYLFK
jgi:hypothetical protein